jgi:hypothetical protein
MIHVLIAQFSPVASWANRILDSLEPSQLSELALEPNIKLLA